MIVIHTQEELLEGKVLQEPAPNEVPTGVGISLAPTVNDCSDLQMVLSAGRVSADVPNNVFHLREQFSVNVKVLRP